MVARTPPKLQLQNKKMAVAPLNPILLRETLNKVDKCMGRLQELQYTVTGGSKVISGVRVSPRSLRCKQESLRIKNASSNRSPRGKLPTNGGGEWRRMSLPAMLLGETVSEILQASQFARKVVEAAIDAPKTPPVTVRPKKKPSPENSDLRARRKREKEVKALPPGHARSRINFKLSSPLHCEKENCSKHMANRVSPRHRPWAKKTVLFPNPMFHTSPSSHQKPQSSRTKSPVILRTQQKTPHKFLIKSPSPSKFQVKIRSPPKIVTSTAAKVKRSFSPSRLANKVVSSPSKLRRSLSPSRLVSRLVSPLKSRKAVQDTDAMKKMMSGLKQRPMPVQIPARRL